MIAHRRIGQGLAWMLVLAAGLSGSSTGGSPDEPPGEETYPRTVRKVWYRTGSARGITGPKLSGDLVITPESLEFLADKQDISIPFDAVWMISLGQMRGDVDTEWVVLSILRGEERELVGLRDGSKLGYGQGTDELYQFLRATARRFSRAQFVAPEGFRPYTELDRVFALAVPAGWSTYHHELSSVEGIIRWGTVVFTPPSAMADPGKAPDPPAVQRARTLEAIQQGRTAAWVVERREAAAGMSCAGFAKGALRVLGGWIADDRFFGHPLAQDDPPRFEPLEIDGCAGLRLVQRGPGPELDAPLLDLRIVAREETVLLMGLRSKVATYEQDREPFERGISSLRLAVTR